MLNYRSLLVSLILLVLSSSLANAQTLEITHYSVTLQKNKTFRIILPDSYNEENYYPVLYLLHGAGGSYTDWFKEGILEKVAKSFDLIIVTPDAENSWYLDSPIETGSKYETYFIKDLIPYIEANFNAVDTYRARGIAGLSMGGHGAITLAIKNPDTFAAASSLSGVLDLISKPNATGLKDILGNLEANITDWEENSALELVGRLKKAKRRPKLLFDIGMADPYYKTNLDFHMKLKAFGLEHTFKVFEGNHNWEYWLSHIKEHVEFYVQNLRKPIFSDKGEM